MLLWCLNGRGQVTVNAQSFTFGPNDFLFLPWEHAITYQADLLHPFLLGGVHVIPDFALDVPITYGVAHTLDSPLFDVPARRDAPMRGCDEIIHGVLSATPGLAHLAEYCVVWFQQSSRVEAEARLLGTLFLAEIERVAATQGQVMDAPAQLQSLLTAVRARLDEPFTLTMLAAQARCSIPTLIRLFQRHLGLPPLQWITRERLAQATRLLMTTRLPISVIGQTVGICDPYYFTKCFTKRYGMPPTAYRRRMSIM